MKTRIEPLPFTRHLNGIEAFTTLRGTVDADNPYSEINLCNYTGDSEAHVSECRLMLCRTLGIEPQMLVMPRQTHTASVITITEDFFRLTPAQQQAALSKKDAIVTNQLGVAIGVNTADCVPIVLACPTRHIIAAVHAGWKGTVKRIAEAAIDAMKALGANPSDIHAAIGASICHDCFEVGPEVVQQFADAAFPIAQITKVNATTGKHHINLQQANALVLMQCGIPADNIAFSHQCTRCQPLRYFSARRMGINSGRTFTGIIQRPHTNT